MVKHHLVILARNSCIELEHLTSIGKRVPQFLPIILEGSIAKCFGIKFWLLHFMFIS